MVQVMEVASFSRPDKGSAKGIKVAGIRKLHSITRTEEGHLLGKELTCLECIRDKSSICDDCKKLKPFYIPKVVDVTLHEETDTGEDIEEGNEVEYREQTGAGLEDGGASDEELQDEEHEEEEEDDNTEVYGPGSVAWARLWGEKAQWFPVLVLGTQDIPAEQATLLHSDTMFVRRFFYNDIRIVKKKFLDGLGENKIDGKRSSKSIEILQAYNMALSERID